jgi:hypothetical protein
MDENFKGFDLVRQIGWKELTNEVTAAESQVAQVGTMQ